MSGLGYLGTIIIGGLAGWIANLVFNRRRSLPVDILIGVSGSIIGALVARQFDLHILPGLGTSLMLSTLIAVLLLAVFGLFRRRG